MLERTLNLKIDETYPKLKVAFANKGYKVIYDEPPNQIRFNRVRSGESPLKQPKKQLLQL
jgi:hypothetical protein